MRIKSIIWTILLTPLFPFFSNAQNPWQEVEQPATGIQSPIIDVLPTKYRLLDLNASVLEEIINPNSTKETCLELPLPNGGFECFEFEASSVMHQDLAKKYPYLKTFKGKSVENPSMTLRFVWNADAFHAMVFSEEGVIFIDKVTAGDTPFHISYYDKDVPKGSHTCETHNHNEESYDDFIDPNNNTPNISNNIPEIAPMASPYAVGTELRTYRFALSLAGEVTVNMGGVANALTWVTNRTSDLNLLYERELCVHLDLIPNNDTLIFPDPATDPYSGNDWLGEARTLIPAMMGSSNYDIGHLIKPTGGGVAYVGVICNNSYKSGGTSSTSLNTHAHEIGHQMSGSHTFNSCGQYGGGDFEPGSGNTILSYDGLCGSENMPGGGYYQYHSSSFQEMRNHLFTGGGSSCAATSVTGNTPPVVTVPTGGFTIPILTPFKLVGSATDDGGSAALTYSWEQYDHGTNQTPPQNPSGNAPIFQTLPYTSESDRTIPKLSKIINGTNDIGEVMPTYTRDLNFRLMVHDNNPGKGGVDYGELLFHVDAGAGPFEVLIPNGNNTIWSEGQTRTVTWDVSNTDVAPVSCAKVNILISFDGGFTYPTTLASNVTNDGSHDIVVPNAVGTQNRIKVEAAGNIFFDISDEDFEIVSGSTNDFSFDVTPDSRSVCTQSSVDYTISTQALGVFSSTIDLTVTGLPTGATSNFPLNVAATSTTTLTVSGLNAVAEGNYLLTVTGTENGGGVTHSQIVYLIVQGTPEGIPGTSMSFDNSDYISVPQTGQDYQFGSTKSFSVECWIKTTTTSSDDAIISNEDWDNSYNPGWTMSIESGRIGFNVADGSNRTRLRTSTTYNDGAWHHIVGTLDRTSSLSRVYIDGDLVLETGIGHIGNINNNLIIGIGAAAENDWKYLGEIEEARVWRKALTTTEVRENMHRTIDVCNLDLISCWQFNEASGDVLDVVGQYDGTVSGATRITSTAPFGKGTANTQLEMSGLVNFTGTDYSANYVTQDAATVTATKIDLTPFGTTGIAGTDAPLDNQYWVVNRYEKTGSFSADMTFATNEDILASDEANPAGMILYYRAYNSDGTWTFLANASAANDANNTVTFSNIPNYGQYLIARSNGSIIGLVTSQIDFCRNEINAMSEVLSYEVSGVNLTNDILISVTGNFEISLDSLNNYGTNLTLTQAGGNVPLTKVFVRTTPTATGAYAGQIDHTSNNASTKSVTLNGFGLEAMQDIAADALKGDGNGDYATISGLNWQPTVFSIEFWLKPFSFSNYNHKVGVGWGTFWFHANSNASFHAGINTGSHRIQSPANTLKQGKWNHIAVTFDNGVLTVYHNGALIGTINNVALPNAWNGNFKIGDTGGDALDGHLDEFRIWNTARTAQQIRENMHLTLDIGEVCEEGLLVYYQFKDNGNNTVTDAAGNYDASMMGDITFIASDVPVADGVAVTKAVQAAQNYSFDDGMKETNLDITFSNTLPLGEVVVSYLTGEDPHGNSASTNTLTPEYWIVNNYGTNLSGINAEMIFQTPSGWAEYSATTAYEMHKRPSGSVGTAGWVFPPKASSVDTNTDEVAFAGVTEFSQFIISKDLAATCSDGIMNGDETGTDCGGTCAPCENCNFTVIDVQDFEAGWGIWTDGGTDASRVNEVNFANSGTYSIRLRDDTGTSHTTTGDMDLSMYNEVQVYFFYMTNSMDNPNEDFWLQMSTDGGTTFTTIEEWNEGDEFENNQRYFDNITISGPFTATTRFRFQCDASGDQDWVYLDDITITACEYTCMDSIQNGDETGVDCGGATCPTCPTCSDGIQNGYETGVDCGGSCTPCGPITTSCIGTAMPNAPVNSGTEIISVLDTLTSTSQITASAMVHYYAEKTIFLKPNFQADNGTVFTAKIQTCTSTCFDGIQNGDETGIDCGGSSCPPCGGPTCSDGIQNGDETGVDCGGTYCANCPPMPTCTDGIQNGTETGVDCGGSCAACPAPCLVTQVLNDTLFSGSHLFNVTDTLTSSHVLLAATTVDYRAGKSIFFVPGFSAISGVQFLAKIETCMASPLIENEDKEIQAIFTQFEKDVVEDSVSVKERLEKPYILIFPNPTSDQLQVQIKTERFQLVEMTVQNALGRMMDFSEASIDSEISQSSLDVSNYPPGMYWLRIRFVEDGDWQAIQFMKN
ncbi:MAG: zinc-dependent metalloprotease family protein [Saprospiraceae bacterium]|jgi:hypothetical protein|nr:zinc-dependent metalloprotease family protein [Saprospiraceae bacterium]